MILKKYFEYRKIKKMEKEFPRFLYSLVEDLRAGMTLPQALKASSEIKYGELTPLIKKMAVQIDWGLPFDKILNFFAKSTGSKIIFTSCSTLLEMHRAGGNIADSLELVAKSLTEVEKIKKERHTYMHFYRITSYLVFLIFLAIMLILSRFLIPSLTSPALPGIKVNLGGIKEIFLEVILIQSFFSGIAIGKLAEGKIIAGLKHSLFLITIGAIAFLFFG